ncbi:hypothetical protein [Aliivibrio fischeri]|uniref:hypothetical protein n=1 Tax=Aliivibrio fischeri TaxID=668 RepID=UPI0012DA0ABC|nr:hypothetical protein [Aliivibrio fischeri]MUJ25108.1 hypothetical protein [Aliivibrio fischeri]
MKRINILLSIAIITFLAACSDSSSGTSGGAAPAAADVPKKESGIKTSELSVPEGFTFSTEREVTFDLSVASSQSDRGFMSIYTEFNEGAVDYTSQIILTPMNDSTEFKSSMMLPNHVDKVWVEIWYPSALGSEIKQMIDIVDNTVVATL